MFNFNPVKKMKLLNKYKVFTLAAVAGLMSTSCDLYYESPNEYQDYEVTNAAQLAVGMYNAYQKIPANEFYITELRSDNMNSESGNGDPGLVQSWSYDANYGEASFYWANNYSVILNANYIIELEDEIAGDGGTGDKSLAEAYFMRALSHFNLVRTFERVPYIDAVLESVDDLDQFTLDFDNPTKEYLYNYLVNDLTTSIDYFIAAGDNGTSNKANLGAAYAFLAKVYLSHPNKDYSAAYSVLSTYLHPDTNTFGYALEATLEDVFDEDNELNEEILFAVSYEPNSTPSVTSSIAFDDQVQGQSQEWSFQMTEFGTGNGIVLTDDYINLVNSITDTSDGTVTYDSGETLRGMNNRIPYNNDEYYYYLSPDRGDFYSGKHIDTSETSGRDWIVLRYSDVLLLMCEAIMEGNDTTDSDAIAFYNLVRERAGATTLATDGTETLTQEMLLNERRIELVGENHRLWDLIRFGEAAAAQTLAEYGASLGFTFSQKYLYFPIPQREIDATGGECEVYCQIFQ